MVRGGQLVKTMVVVFIGSRGWGESQRGHKSVAYVLKNKDVKNSYVYMNMNISPKAFDGLMR